MGDRFWINVTCPKCGFHHDDMACYAPTCGITEWTCRNCDSVINLEEYTGVTKEDASNKAKIESVIKNLS